MEIRILGTRGEIEKSCPYHSKHSGVLIDKKILLDIGEERFLKYKPKYIFITHFHPDHAFFVEEPEKKDKIAPQIYSPENLRPEKPIKLDRYKIIPIPTLHGKKVKSVAYLIKKSGKRLLYTGDMVWINKKYHKVLRNLDLVITEASFYRKGGLVRRDKKTGEIYGHTGVPNLISLFKKFTSHIIFLHFGTWFYKNVKQARKKFAKLAEENGIKITVGYDNLKIKI